MRGRLVTSGRPCTEYSVPTFCSLHALVYCVKIHRNSVTECNRVYAQVITNCIEYGCFVTYVLRTSGAVGVANQKLEGLMHSSGGCPTRDAKSRP